MCGTGPRRLGRFAVSSQLSVWDNNAVSLTARNMYLIAHCSRRSPLHENAKFSSSHLAHLDLTPQSVLSRFTRTRQDAHVFLRTYRSLERDRISASSCCPGILRLSITTLAGSSTSGLTVTALDRNVATVKLGARGCSRLIGQGIGREPRCPQTLRSWFANYVARQTHYKAGRCSRWSYVVALTDGVECDNLPSPIFFSRLVSRKENPAGFSFTQSPLQYLTHFW